MYLYQRKHTLPKDPGLFIFIDPMRLLLKKGFIEI